MATGKPWSKPAIAFISFPASSTIFSTIRRTWSIWKWSARRISRRSIPRALAKFRRPRRGSERAERSERSRAERGPHNSEFHIELVDLLGLHPGRIGPLDHL